MFRSSLLFLALTLFLSACTEEVLPEPELEADSETEARPEPESESESILEIALIGLEDDGNNGPMVGCGDSLISVFQETESNQSPEARIENALSALFAIESPYYGESGLYNALSSSDLMVEDVQISDEVITVNLTGTLLSGGACDDPRITAQIYQSVLDNSGMPSDSLVQVNLNAQDLETLLNGQGE